MRLRLERLLMKRDICVQERGVFSLPEPRQQRAYGVLDRADDAQVDRLTVTRRVNPRKGGAAFVTVARIVTSSPPPSPG